MLGIHIHTYIHANEISSKPIMYHVIILIQMEIITELFILKIQILLIT